MIEYSIIDSEKKTKGNKPTIDPKWVGNGSQVEVGSACWTIWLMLGSLEESCSHIGTILNAMLDFECHFGSQIYSPGRKTKGHFFRLLCFFLTLLWGAFFHDF